jgi:hypothetical protein
VVIRSVEALATEGAVRLDGVRVRTAHWADPDGSPDPDHNIIGTLPGVPRGLRPARGFVVPSTCEALEEPLGEVVVTLTKLGEEGGRVDGLQVVYESDGDVYAFDIGFSFELCGTGDGIERCQES